MANMTKLFDQAKDKNVANFIVYGKTADTTLYYDAAMTVKLKQADAEDAFKKGRLVIFNSNTYYVPISLAGGKVKTVGTASSAVALTEWATEA